MPSQSQSQITRLLQAYLDKVTQSKAARYFANLVAGMSASGVFYGVGVAVAGALGLSGVGLPVALAILAALVAIGVNEYEIRKKLKEQTTVAHTVAATQSNSIQLGVLSDALRKHADEIASLKKMIAANPQLHAAAQAIESETKGETSALLAETKASADYGSSTAGLNAVLAHVPSIDPALLVDHGADAKHLEVAPLITSETREESETAYDMSSVTTQPPASLIAVLETTPNPKDDSKKESLKKKRSLSAEDVKSSVPAAARTAASTPPLKSPKAMPVHSDDDIDGILGALRNLHLHSPRKTGITGATSPKPAKATEKTELLSSQQRNYG